ncbi:dihydropteroate synthase [Haloferax sp. ATB1]|uniref:dihydropteroate synthase n=1 Tax=Haloferax sp. ATB1 TaxID=1508454 RepID=UPI0005B22A4F|nr:dihydropteroate synthase [Haloferax sp. ATB1]
MSRSQTLESTDQTQVMGILNVTPDSFSDGGCYTSLESAVERARKIDEAGADIIDIGGESTRPGADPVSVQEEQERILPILERITSNSDIDALVSVDTYKPKVAKAALDAGADIINDQNGLEDPEMQSLVAGRECRAVLMDAVNLPVDNTYSPKTDDIVADVCERLEQRVERARAAGVSDDQLILDPGIGFGTDTEGDLELLARTDEFTALSFPVLVGASRKSFATEFSDLPSNERVGPSLAAHLVAAKGGADIVRVHDVTETVTALRTAEGLWNRQRNQ